MTRRTLPQTDHADRILRIAGVVARDIASGTPRDAAVTRAAIALRIDRGAVAYCVKAARDAARLAS